MDNLRKQADMNDRTELEAATYRPEVKARFWARVDQSGGPDACWPWMLNRDKRSGYGRLRVDTIGFLPHRWLLGMLRGKPLAWSEGEREMACHRCDNPPCCNPTHLYVGDQYQNMRDSVERGRHAEASQTSCKYGHLLAGDNLYVRSLNGWRGCRTCRRRSSQENTRRKSSLRSV